MHFDHHVRGQAMRLVITGDGVKPREELRDFISRRLYFALGRFATEIRAVTARLDDVNGPKGGMDKRCRIMVRVKGLENVIKEAGASELEVAVASAADGVARGLARALERRRDRKRRPGGSMAGEADLGWEGPPTANSVSKAAGRQSSPTPAGEP